MFYPFPPDNKSLQQVVRARFSVWESTKAIFELEINYVKLSDWCETLTERDNLTDVEKSKQYSQNMAELSNELAALRTELQNLMVRFGLRALKLYQTGTPEPLQPQQMSYLIKYELTNAVDDVKEPKTMETIINLTKEEWKKLQKK